jgi:outer membrane protein assembly factor BamE (lipoprotein component of BamABCDE complex)
MRTFRFGLRDWLAGIVVCALALSVVRYVFIDNQPVDLLMWAVSAWDGHSTVYAQGYRESSFRAVQVGMTEAEVEALLGRPLWQGHWYGSPGLEGNYWSYTEAAKSPGSYWRRSVHFLDGKVHTIDRHFYVD